MSDRRALLTIFCAAFALCALITKSHVLSWNDGSRFATVDAVTADHTVAIDGSPYAVGLGDKIRYRGRTYSDKPPLLALLGAGVAWAAAPFGAGLRTHSSAAIYAITLLTVGVWFAIGCCYAYAFQRVLGQTQRIAFAVAALTGSATLALSYAGVFTNHVPAGAAALAGSYHLVRARGGRPDHAAAGGFFLALAVAFDAAAVSFAAAALVLLWGLPLRHWVLAILAALPVFAGQVAYNIAITGSVVPAVFNAEVWNDPSLPLHDWSHQLAHVYSPVEYAGFALYLLAGRRGLFTYTPLMLAAAYGFVTLARGGPLGARVTLAVCATACLYYLTIVFLQNDLTSRSFGERRYVDLFFVLAIGLGPALASIRDRVADVLFRLAVAVSIAIAALGTLAPFGGAEGDWGFRIGASAFTGLLRRAPLQAALDVALLCLVIAVVETLVTRAHPRGEGLTSGPTRNPA